MYRSPLVRKARITSSFADHVKNRPQFAGTDLVYADGKSKGEPLVAVTKMKCIHRQDTFWSQSQPKRNGEKYLLMQDVNDISITFLYLHNDENLVDVGQIVEAGDKIATMGDNGWATGVHLHFEARINGVKKDPEQYVDFNNFLNNTQNNMSKYHIQNEEDLNNWIRKWGLNRLRELGIYDSYNYVPKIWHEEAKEKLQKLQKVQPIIKEKIVEVPVEKEVIKEIVKEVEVENPLLVTRIKELEATNNRLHEQLEEAQTNNQWSFQKFFVGLSKNGTAYAALIGLTSYMFNYFGLTDLSAQEIWRFIMIIAGGQNLQVAASNLNKEK